MTTAEHVKRAEKHYNDLGKESFSVGYLNIIHFTEEHGLKFNLCHMVMGMASELGELVNCTGTQLKVKVDLPNLKEELGDIYWYLSNYCRIRELPVPDSSALQLNIDDDKCFDLLISSVSELTDLIKKYIAYNRPIDKAKELDTIYDIYCALKAFENIYSLSGDEVRLMNITKLDARYGAKFSEQAANNRNLDNERQVLEGKGNSELPTNEIK